MSARWPSSLAEVRDQVQGVLDKVQAFGGAPPPAPATAPRQGLPTWAKIAFGAGAVIAGAWLLRKWK